MVSCASENSDFAAGITWRERRIKNGLLSRGREGSIFEVSSFRCHSTHCSERELRFKISHYIYQPRLVYVLRVSQGPLFKSWGWANKVVHLPFAHVFFRLFKYWGWFMKFMIGFRVYHTTYIHRFIPYVFWDDEHPGAALCRELQLTWHDKTLGTAAAVWAKTWWTTVKSAPGVGNDSISQWSWYQNLDGLTLKATKKKICVPSLGS
jgi:hypothetical protein